jgi:ribose 1,5-bisphosphokinase
MTTSAPIGPGRLVLIVGPSGAGKDTLIAGAKASCVGDSTIIFPRRVVTRPATQAEDHNSLDNDAFDDAEKRGAFVVSWHAHGLRYGIPRSAEDDIRAGRTIVCNVSRGIVAELRARFARVTVVLISAPPDVLAGRLAGRSRATDGSLAQRVERNDVFVGFCADRTIENIGPPQSATQSLLDIIYQR